MTWNTTFTSPDPLIFNSISSWPSDPLRWSIRRCLLDTAVFLNATWLGSCSITSMKDTDLTLSELWTTSADKSLQYRLQIPLLLRISPSEFPLARPSYSFMCCCWGLVRICNAWGRWSAPARRIDTVRRKGRREPARKILIVYVHFAHKEGSVLVSCVYVCVCVYLYNGHRKKERKDGGREYIWMVKNH